MKARYKLVKNNNLKKYMDLNVANSYDINKKIDKNEMGKIKFYNQKLISGVIKKKTDIKFKQILQMLIDIEESDSDPSEGMMICLNELDKLNKQLINQYNKFIEKKQFEFLSKKIELLAKEIKMKLFNIQMINNPIIMNNDGLNYEEEKESTRRR